MSIAPRIGTKGTIISRAWTRLWGLGAACLFAAAGIAQDDPAWNPSDQELRLSAMPGFLSVHDRPAGFSKSEVAIDAALTYFIHPHIGIYLPYRFVKFNNTPTHLAGGGLDVRVVDLKGFQVELFGHLNWQRVFKGSYLGWGSGLMAQYQWNRKGFFQPAIGPFFKWDQTFLNGKDLKTYTVGLGLHLSGHSDMDW